MEINSRVQTATAKIRGLKKKMLCGESLKALSLEEEGGGCVLFSPLNVALTMVVINVLSLLGEEYRKEFP